MTQNKEKHQYSCHKCRATLYFAYGEVDTEVICHKCRRINYPWRSEEALGVRGMQFQAQAKALRCPQCHALRFLYIDPPFGDFEIETICKVKSCSLPFSVQKIKGKVSATEPPDKEKSKKLRESLAL